MAMDIKYPEEKITDFAYPENISNSFIWESVRFTTSTGFAAKSQVTGQGGLILSKH